MKEARERAKGEPMAENTEQDGAELKRQRPWSTATDPVSHTCTHPHRGGLPWIIPNARSHGSATSPSPGCAGHQQGRELNQHFVSLLSTSCSASAQKDM